MAGIPADDAKIASQAGLLRSQIGTVMLPVDRCIINAAGPRDMQALPDNQHGQFGYWSEQ